MSTRSSYAASTNPARKAKRARLGNLTDASQDPADLRSASPHQPFILPKPASKPIVDTPPAMTLPPVKRGRKPSGVSRASREAQRKLNHSIIEKARRTKINEALSTLSSLIPTDYDTRPDGADDTGKEDAEDSGDDDGDYVDRKQTAGRRGGPKKEKEFKLEILVKTVAFMQDLIQRVTDLEAEAKAPVPVPAPLPSSSCATCSTRTATKRKRGASDSLDGAREPASDERAIPRLPSISEMLSERARDVDMGSYLPSPPSSTKFPARGRSDSLDIPPPLSLGPTLQAAAAKSSSFGAQSCAPTPVVSPVTSPLLTPEDESAASLLLNMRTSTTRGHGMMDLGEGDGGFLSRSREYNRMQKQTPSSLLGIVS